MTTCTELNEQVKSLVTETEYCLKQVHCHHPLWREYTNLKRPVGSGFEQWYEYIDSLTSVISEIPHAIRDQPNYSHKKFEYRNLTIQVTPYWQSIEHPKMCGMDISRFAIWDWVSHQIDFDTPFRVDYLEMEGEKFTDVYQAMQEIQDGINYVVSHY